jgi:hypothetical protein
MRPRRVSPPSSSPSSPAYTSSFMPPPSASSSSHSRTSTPPHQQAHEMALPPLQHLRRQAESQAIAPSTSSTTASSSTRAAPPGHSTWCSIDPPSTRFLVLPIRDAPNHPMLHQKALSPSHTVARTHNTSRAAPNSSSPTPALHSALHSSPTRQRQPRWISCSLYRQFTSSRAATLTIL